MVRVSAVILGAGQSSRMGSPKTLLRLDNTTFLGRLLKLYVDLGIPFYVVLGPDWREITRHEKVPADRLLLNEFPDRGPISSLRIALSVLDPTTTAVIPHPVDHPLVKGTTLQAVVSAHEEHPGSIIVPTFKGRPGHPTLFPSRYFSHLADAPWDQGARWVVRQDSVSRVDLEVLDPGICANIDTPSDYRRWVGLEC